MENNKLQEDLLREFKEEADFVATELEHLNSLVVSLNKPVVTRVLNSMVLLVLEGMCWIAIAATIAFCIVRDKVYPFYVLARLRTKEAELGFSHEEVNNLYGSVIIFAALIILLLLVIARNLNKLRRKNKLLQTTASHIKAMAGEVLKRKAAIAAIEQRHFGILEPEPPKADPAKSTDVPNPGY